MLKLIFLFLTLLFPIQAVPCTGIYYNFPDNSMLPQNDNVTSTCESSYCAKISVELEDKTKITAMDCLDTLIAVIDNYLQGKHGTTESFHAECDKAIQTWKSFEGPGKVKYTLICSANSKFTDGQDPLGAANAMMLNLLLICFAVIFKF
uniref:Uncharacterized protein n=1 Tax=Panagrolaimus sp. JU765 TaxID=591449 RepID=A0AC34QKH2_9BILA